VNISSYALPTDAISTHPQATQRNTTAALSTSFPEMSLCPPCSGCKDRDERIRERDKRFEALRLRYEDLLKSRHAESAALRAKNLYLELVIIRLPEAQDRLDSNFGLDVIH
jgi:hypothetical protein